MELHIIHAGFLKLDGGAMFGVVPQVIWKKLNPPDKNNLCTWAMRLMLVEQGDRLMLIDTGMGNKQSEKFFSYYEPHGPTLEGELKEKGFSPDDITDVLLTHLHFDHCGGAVKREGDLLVPAFKNATYWSHRQHWEWATVNPNPREKASFLKENIMPIEESGQLKFIEEEGPVMEGVDYLVANGHTESQIIPKIKYGDRTIVYMADMMPSVAHVPVNYVMGYDVRPLVTMEENSRFLDTALEEDYILFFEHDRENECCTLRPTEKGVRPAEVLKLVDIL